VGLVASVNATGGATADGLTMNQLQDVAAISPRLRENGTMGVATILSMEPGAGAATRISLEVDSVVEKKRVVTTEQVMNGFSYSVGDRAYIFVDKTDPNMVALVPLSFTGGQKLDATANRLDPLVLGPQILHEGKKGEGTVTAAEQVPLNNPVLESRGMQRWRLTMHIAPADSTPAYDADVTITFTTQDKVERICKVGATVPVRYDGNDPKSFVTDSMALGYPDPYETVIAALKAQAKAGV